MGRSDPGGGREPQEGHAECPYGRSVGTGPYMVGL